MLRFELTWDEDLAHEDISWGWLQIWYGDTLLWGPRDKGWHWTWEELLDYLVDEWAPLLLEEAPEGIVLTPEEYWDSYTKLMRSAQTPAREQALYEFMYSHDLSNAGRGVVLPPFRIIRQGPYMWVSTRSEAYVLTHAEVSDFLRELGDALAERLFDKRPDAVELWVTRLQINVSELSLQRKIDRLAAAG